MNTITKTARISALLPFSLVQEIKKESEIKNITQSHIIKKALELWFRKKLESDAKELAKIDFTDLPSENEWSLIQSKIN
ncbi:hypothetical protein COT99_01170 [Candidatus Falkowbacteria bacterium CG10_big_fil_rev_8_21_14_0_10_43_10]|uniref:Ribbon-helix-helix protein CopG domain-containing protein n=1 Tax=Candidatus Falkowbacteria bacterium CG10_big_fil_rev_8_21_14_0_10_43_10 TaxID=1974567 RepID=A0A2H0V2Q1_9BACT|nr:MAG: hypothetical protein COT99_01170 [Candidatus Falkowbacteria bacterium CG10_big_fil_rev_8_21_14_0_10_43_10]